MASPNQNEYVGMGICRISLTTPEFNRVPLVLFKKCWPEAKKKKLAELEAKCQDRWTKNAPEYLEQFVKL